MKIQSSIALVTGANRGIGHELVKALLWAGAGKVYAGARRLESLDATNALDPRRVVPLKIDVTDLDLVDALPSKASDVTILVNNAGVLNFGPILDTPFEAIDRIFATNFHGKLNMARAFAPVIEKNGGGAIVNILTLLALASMPSLSAYNASKAAAWSMTQSLRAGLADRGIAVHGVFPGAVDTDMLADVEMPKAMPADVATAIVAGIVAGQEDIFPDQMSSGLYQEWRLDHKAVERQFATM